MQGDCTGPVSAQFVLKDPWWTWPCWKPRAVAWCAAASASSSCDVGICTNVAADHLGLKDINTLEDLAQREEHRAPQRAPRRIRHTQCR
jgi:cyanophycin synthetase